jgi:hypothetical protein
VGTTDVDFLTGIWQFEFPGTAPADVTVTSPLGGSVTSGPVKSVVRPANGSSLQQIESITSLDNDDEVNFFRPQPHKERPISLISNPSLRTTEGHPQANDQFSKKPVPAGHPEPIHQ